MRFLVRRGVAAGLFTGAVLAGAAVAAGPASGVAGSSPAPADGYGFVAHVRVGGAVRACSGALVDPEWVITAKSCFAEGADPVSTGPPTRATTVTVGREDLTATGEGQVRAVTHVVPYPARDLLLAKLATPVADVAPVKIGTTAPAVGEVLRVAGFGRTAGAWVPDRLHVGSFAVRTVTANAVDIAGDQATPASVCKGDAGGPALRAVGSSFEVVALNNASWQAGCVGMPASETRNGATETRLDNLREWVRQTVRGGNFVRLSTSAQVLNTLGGSGALAPGGSITFPVTNRDGIPATGVTAVLVDVTAVSTGPTYLTVVPEGAPVNQPFSMLNAAANQIISNTAVVPVPASGKLTLHNNLNTADALVDVQGYYTTAANSGGGFVPIDHTRVVDSRGALGGGAGILPPHGTREFTLTKDVNGRAVIPNGAQVALVDLIVTDATAHGWIAAYPPGGTNNRSVMDYVPGTTSHAVAVQLNAEGRAVITNNGSSAVHIIMTATGYHTTAATGADLRTMTGVRKLDTRTVGNGAPLAANADIEVALGLPAGSAALVNLTVVANTADGLLHAWPSGGTETNTSLTNYPGASPAAARAGLAVVKVGTDGKIRVRNVSAGTAHVLLDLQGWYAQPLLGSAAGAAQLPPSGGGGSAAAQAADAPTSVVEDFTHPGAEQILADHDLKVFRGDGHIVFVTSRTFAEGQCPTGQIQVEKQMDVEPYGTYYCFRTFGTQGFLTLEVPGTFGVRGGDKPIVATAELPSGVQEYAVPANGFVAIGPGDGSELPQGILVELRLGS